MKIVNCNRCNNKRTRVMVMPSLADPRGFEERVVLCARCIPTDRAEAAKAFLPKKSAETP